MRFLTVQREQIRWMEEFWIGGEKIIEYVMIKCKNKNEQKYCQENLFWK